MLDIVEILKILPHRYPFLLIDRVIEIEPGRRVVAIKNVSINEPFFEGHFPGHPIMPGVLLVEAIAQACGALLLTEAPRVSDKLMVFSGIDRARFRKPVLPGDQLRIEGEVIFRRAAVAQMHGTVQVDGKVACEATVMCHLVNKPAGQKS
jgi:3-hydroxyacyl-[acyl-carrier-protein] dehydratase